MNQQVKIGNQKFWTVTLILGAWTLYGLFFASQTYLQGLYLGRNADLQRALVVWLTCGYSWAILTPPILFLIRRFRFDRDNWLRALLVHIPASVLFSLAALAIFTGFQFLLGQPGSFARYGDLVIGEIHASILVYFGILGVSHAVNYFRLVRRKAEPEFGIQLQDENSGPAAGAEVEPYPLPQKNGSDGPQPVVFPERFSIKENGRILFVKVDELDRVTSEGNYVKLHVNGRSHLLRETMKSMEQKLDPDVFLRVRRSAIVRIDHIRELHPLFNGEFEIVLKNGSTITSSRRYRKNLDGLLKT